MKAMVIEQFGEPNAFVEKEIPRPAVTAGHVLIEVHATSVNPVDILIRQLGPDFLAPALPAVLHCDVAGVVIDVAPDVRKFKVGDHVYGCAGGLLGMGGALSEYMLADADLIACKPKSLSMTEAAAMPLVTITAWEGLHERAKISPGQKVLIHGGAGGVGHIAVQLARHAGAKVYATVSSDAKATIARKMGATATINYRERLVGDYVAEFTDGQGFDTIFDTVGNGNLIKSFEATKLNGHVVTTVALGQCDTTIAHLRGLSLHVVFMLIPLIHGINRARHGRILAEAATLADEGKLRPLVETQLFPISEVSAAHALMESGEHVGKIVVTRD